MGGVLVISYSSQPKNLHPFGTYCINGVISFISMGQGLRLHALNNVVNAIRPQINIINVYVHTHIHIYITCPSTSSYNIFLGHMFLFGQTESLANTSPGH